MRHIWKTFALVAAIGLLFGTAQAGTILVVSDAQVPGVDGGNHNDDSLVAFLEGFGTVDTSGMNGQMKEGDAVSPFAPGNEAKLQALNDADLIVVSRRTGSGGYDNERERQGWNGLSTPLILQSSYLTRGGSTKWGWTDTNHSKVGAAVTDMAIETAEASHPFVSGLATAVAMFDWSKDNGDPGTAPKSIEVPSWDDPVGDTFKGLTALIAQMDGLPMLIDMPAGTDLDQGGSLKFGTTGGRRAFLGHWGYDDGYPAGTNGSDGGPSDWEDYITDDYKTVFGNMITTMIPEPGTVSMLIAGLLGLVLWGWRRRKS